MLKTFFMAVCEASLFIQQVSIKKLHTVQAFVFIPVALLLRTEGSWFPYISKNLFTVYCYSESFGASKPAALEIVFNTSTVS